MMQILMVVVILAALLAALNSYDKQKDSVADRPEHW